MDVMAKRAGSVPFDPFYDPMTAPKLGPGSDYAPTYWIGTAGEIPDDDGPVTGDMDVDVAVIGSGYTGLSCAIHLAKMHGIKATVLEANGVAYGCSTRNGGQAQISSGRLKRSQWIARWGLESARALHDEVVEAFDLFRGLIRDHGIDCQPQDGGHYYIAHKASAMPALESETRLLNETFGYGARMLDRDELFRTVARDHEAHGAMWEPDGVGIHAARLAFGYLRVARELGATVHPDSPVQGWVLKDGIHHLRTPGGTVRARRGAVATAAYAPRALHPRLKDRLMPIMSNSVVTRVLTPDELDAVGIRKLSPLTDTRTLRHYYRLLPDNRLQIGSRAAITGRDAANPAHLKALRQGMARKFPVLRGIAAARLARTGGFHARVERQKVGLECDLVDDADDLGDLAGRLLDAAHGRDRLADDLVAASGIDCHFGDRDACLAGAGGRGRDGTADLAYGRDGLLDGGGLLFRAARQIVGGAADFARAVLKLPAGLHDPLHGVLEPIHGEIEVVLQLLVLRREIHLQAGGEVALGQARQRGAD